MLETKPSTTVIYVPRGKAKEYNPLACNLYEGCAHGCLYCYAPDVLRKTRDQFSHVKPRVDIIEKLTKDAAKLGFPWTKPDCPILLCFTCDPYQPGEKVYGITRQAIEILHFYGLSVKILTKGGELAQRDFDLLNDGDWFGVTLTLDNSRQSWEWEPNAALPQTRIQNLEVAHNLGIKTWVSLEPVLDPIQTQDLISQTHSFVDEYKVGLLNHHPLAQEIDWRKFGLEAISLLEKYGCEYYIKEDLRKKL